VVARGRQPEADNGPPKVVFLERGTIGAGVRIGRPSSAHRYVEYERTAPDDVASRLDGATVAIVNKTKLTRAVLDHLPALRMIAVAATGTDNIDLAACRERGIHVANVGDYAVHSVPEHTFALILALSRSLIGFRADVARGGWSAAGQFCLQTHPIADLNGRTLGIMGRGSHGVAVARIAAAFGLRVLFAERKNGTVPRAGYTPFDQVLAESDIISLHCPLTDETRNMIGAREFGLMARRPLLINVSRGALVDDRALVAALRDEIVSGAGIDVLRDEPPARDAPLLTLLDMPNVIVTPHVAWASGQAMQTLIDRTIANVDAFLRSNPSSASADGAR